MTLSVKTAIKNRASEILITCISFSISILFFNIVYDDYISFCFSMASSQFSNYPLIEYHYNGLIGISKLYEIFYSFFPGINWAGIGFEACLLFSLYTSLRFIRMVAMRNTENKWLILIIQVLIALFFIDNFITLSHTRFSLIFCGVGLLNLAFTPHLSIFRLLLYSVYFILGMLHRPESSVGMLVIASVTLLIYKFDILFLIKRYFFPAITLLILLSTFVADWYSTDIYVRKIEPEIEYSIMDRAVVPISTMKTSKDSIKYNAAMVGMWFDTKELSPKFLRSLLIKQKQTIDLTVFVEAGQHLLKLYRFFIFYTIGIVLLLIFSFSARNVFWKVILINIFNLGIMYAISFERLLAERHFSAFLLVSLLASLFYVFEGKPFVFNFNSKTIKITSLTVLFSAIVFNLQAYRTSNNYLFLDANEQEKAMKKIESLFKDRIIVVTIFNFHLFDHNFSIFNKNYNNNQYLIFDCFSYSLVPGYLGYLSKICHCDAYDPVQFFNWLSKNKALYMSAPHRYELTEKFMKIVHNQKLTFINPIILNNYAAINSHKEGQTYEIREVSIAKDTINFE